MNKVTAFGQFRIWLVSVFCRNIYIYIYIYTYNINKTTISPQFPGTYKSHARNGYGSVILLSRGTPEDGSVLINVMYIAEVIVVVAGGHMNMVCS